MRNLSDFNKKLPFGISLQMHGRYGYLYFKNDIGFIEYYVELSGVPQYQFLVWFQGITVWTFHSDKQITSVDKEYIKTCLIDFL